MAAVQSVKRIDPPTLPSVVIAGRGALPRGLRYVELRGLHMLSADEQDELYLALNRVNTATFGKDMTPYWLRRRGNGYLDKIFRLFLVEDPSGGLVGWSGFHRMKLGRSPIFFLDTTGVLPHLQSSGVMWQLQYKALIGHVLPNNIVHRPYIAFRTESAVVYQAFRKVFGASDVFPHIDGSPPPEDVQQIAVRVAEWLGQPEKLDPRSLRLIKSHDTQTTGQYAVRPISGNDEIDRFFAAHLGEIDAFIIILRVRRAMWVTVLPRLLSGHLRRTRAG